MTAGRGNETARTSVDLHRFVVFTTVCTFFLLIAGALVASSDAGLSIPSWPFAPGTLLPRMAGGVPFEYSHWMVAASVGLLTLATAVWLTVVAFRVVGPIGEYATVPTLWPDPRSRQQTVSVRPS